MNKKIKILFFGNGQFGAQFLQQILQKYQQTFEVVGIATNIEAQKKTRRQRIKKIKIIIKKGLLTRELKEKFFFDKLINQKCLKNTPPVYPDIKVKTLAECNGIPVFDCSKVYAGDVDFVDSFNFDFIIVAGFGKIPEKIYSNKPRSVINFHPSFLPKLRGGMPVYSAIRMQMKETGFSFHYLTQKFDAGPLLYQEKFPVKKDHKCRDLEIEIAKAGADKLDYLLSGIKNNSIMPVDVSNRTVSQCFKSYEIPLRLLPLQTKTADILSHIKACHSWALGGAYIRKNFRIFYIVEAKSIELDYIPFKSDFYFNKALGLLMKTMDGIIVITKIYYRGKYYVGDELVKLQKALFITIEQGDTEYVDWKKQAQLSTHLKQKVDSPKMETKSYQ